MSASVRCGRVGCAKVIRKPLWKVQKVVVCGDCMEMLLTKGRVDLDDVERLSDEIEDFEVIRTRKKRHESTTAAATSV